MERPFPGLMNKHRQLRNRQKKEIKFLCHAISSTAIFFILLITIIELRTETVP